MTTDVMERLEKLERQNRRMRLGGVVLGIIALGAFAFGAIKGDRTLEAEELVIRDKGGNERVKLAVDESGPYLRMLDGKGRPRAVLLVQDDRSLFMLPGGATMRSNLMLVNGSEPTLYLTDDNAKIRAELSTKQGMVRMIMTDPDQKESLILAGSKEGPSLQFFDDKQKLRAWLQVAGPISRFSLLDTKQVQRASIHAADESAAFAVTDENEIRRGVLLYGKSTTGTAREGGVMAIFGKYGEPIWTSQTYPNGLLRPAAPVPKVGSPEAPVQDGQPTPQPAVNQATTEPAKP